MRIGWDGNYGVRGEGHDVIYLIKSINQLLFKLHTFTNLKCISLSGTAVEDLNVSASSILPSCTKNLTLSILFCLSLGNCIYCLRTPIC